MSKRLDPFVLPDYETCEEERACGRANALENFIYDYAPRMQDYKRWRASLQLAIQQVLTEFMEKSTTEGPFDISAVWRDDGIRFLRNTDGTYSMEPFDFVEGKETTQPYRYELGRLLRTGQFTFWPPLSSGRNLCTKAGE